MQKIFKVGNSKGITIPKAYADQLGLTEGSLVDIRLIGQELILKSAKPRYTLADLLAETPDGSNEPEVDYGPDIGEEVIA
jgi:AbrB family looped-hinge helix DNA binding protein